jgi:DNA polymerase I-like protein with 3'-5' exonuclease and polymerase domains
MDFFGDSEPLIKRKGARLKALPLVPNTGWRQPEFPNLRDNCQFIGVDTETKDPELNEAGPGWARNQRGSTPKSKGHIVGISLAAVDFNGNRGKWYYPIRHEVGAEDNMDVNNVLAYVQHQLGSPYQPKVFAHAQYDLGWLQDDGIKVAGDLHDVQFAEALIDNNAKVALDVLAEKYMGIHKTSDLAMQWVQAAYGKAGNGPDGWRKNIYRTPPKLVGPYAEDDAALALGLLPLEVAMRYAGVYVDVEEAEKLKIELETNIKGSYEAIERDYSHNLRNDDGEWSTDSKVIGRLLDKLGIQYPRTKPSRTFPNGNASIEKEWLEDLALTHPVGRALNDLREYEKILGTFVNSYVLKKNVKGFLYPTFNPVRGEKNGTMLYRFSSNGPNLQNIPTRTKLGKRVRRLFKPDPGHSHWRKHDYSQIHYRILAHFAVDRGDGSAERLRQAYIEDPDMDYHMNVYQDVAPVMHWSTDYTQTLNKDGDLVYNEEIQDHRRVIKNINFSGLYGVGEETVGQKYLIGMSRAQVKDFLQKYHEGAPYIEATTAAISAEAQQNGYVETLLGRRIRFVLWEPMAFRKGERPIAMRYDDAVANYGSFIQLAFLYRAVNYKFQGSEPDIMKTGMRKLWQSGVFDYTGVPRLTVHDELDWSVTEDSPQMREAFDFIRRTMQDAIRLRVPVKVDATTGPTWGDAK